jgi:hypothetical protein
MTNPSLPPQVPEVPPEFDRRGPNRAASQWVRNALNDQSDKIDKIGQDMHKINDILTKAIPNADWEHHHRSHIILEAREEERKMMDNENSRRMEENRQFWLGVKQDIVKWVLRAVGIFVVGIFILGFQAKFKEWAVAALSESQNKTIEIKK